MKTEFIDVSDTQKNLVVEIPSTVVDAEIDKVARDYSRAARVPGVPARQGAGEGRASAVPRSDPARRRARADSARRRRGAARARRRTGRHARHSRRGRRRRPAAEVHGDLRNGSADRARRLRDHHAAPEEHGGLRLGRGRGAEQSARPGGALRTGRRTRHPARRLGRHGSRAHRHSRSRKNRSS